MNLRRIWASVVGSACVTVVTIVGSGCEKTDRPPAATASAPAAAQVDARVIQIVAEQFGVNKAEINRGVRLKEDLKADDLDTVELTMELEDAFSISISDEDAEKWRTVGDLIDYAKSPRAATRPASSPSI